MTIVISPGEGGTAIARVFAGTEQLVDRFPADPGVASTAKGSSQLKEAVVCFDCRVDQRIHYVTHAIFIGKVRHSNFGDHAPMIYSNFNFHGLGKLQV
ncbi:MAG: flavin reductase [SAR324 cluster bacterium]|nr:flavin reductase [SAR324 cluster bacterium]